MSYFLLQFAFCGDYICFDQISRRDTASKRYESERSRRRRVPLGIASLVFPALLRAVFIFARAPRKSCKIHTSGYLDFKCRRYAFCFDCLFGSGAV